MEVRIHSLHVSPSTPQLEPGLQQPIAALVLIMNIKLHFNMIYFDYELHITFETYYLQHTLLVS